MKHSLPQHQEDDFIPFLKNLKRATPKPSLFSEIEQQIHEEHSISIQKISSFQLKIAAAAACVLLVLNSYFIFETNTTTDSQSASIENSTSLISSFNLYD